MVNDPRLHRKRKKIMADETRNTPDDLDEAQNDALAATGRALAGLVPMFGGVIGELITKVIPNQRTERVVKYVRELNQRLETVETNIDDLLDDPENVDLIEEGGFQAARATSEKRISQIATLVANGLSAENSDLVRRKRLARLLRQIDEDELVLLNAYGQSYGGDRSVWNAVQRPDPAHMGSSVEEIDAEQLYDAGREHLLRLGLLRKNYRKPPRGQAPTFDTRKGDYEHSMEVSYLGRLLLRYLDMPSPIDAREE